LYTLQAGTGDHHHDQQLTASDHQQLAGVARPHLPGSPMARLMFDPVEPHPHVGGDLVPAAQARQVAPARAAQHSAEGLSVGLRLAAAGWHAQMPVLDRLQQASAISADVARMTRTVRRAPVTACVVAMVDWLLLTILV
jgi:hypothetical protein